MFFWKICWLQQLNIIKTPNISGCWRGKGKSIYGQTQSEFEIELDISQTWTNISITAEGKDSESWSTSAHMFISNTQKKSITYTYINDPKAHAVETMSMHEGTITLSLKDKALVLEGTYYTGRGRQTYGSIRLDKVVD